MVDTRDARIFQITGNRLLKAQFNWDSASLRVAILAAGTEIDFDRHHFLSDYPTSAVVLDEALRGTAVVDNIAKCQPGRWLGIEAPGGIGGYVIYEVATAIYKGRSGAPLVFGSRNVSAPVPVDALTDVVLFFQSSIGGPFYL
jgi:hypothetical protein